MTASPTLTHPLRSLHSFFTNMLSPFATTSLSEDMEEKENVNKIPKSSFFHFRTSFPACF